jgi:hypothetical protein
MYEDDGRQFIIKENAVKHGVLSDVDLVKLDGCEAFAQLHNLRNDNFAIIIP